MWIVFLLSKRMWLVISSVFLKVKNLSRSQPVKYTVYVVISEKCCKLESLLLQTTHTKWHMADQIVIDLGWPLMEGSLQTYMPSCWCHLLAIYIGHWHVMRTVQRWRAGGEVCCVRLHLVCHCTIFIWHSWCCRAAPYQVMSGRCRICKSSVHQPGSHYCQGCAYKKGLSDLSKF